VWRFKTKEEYRKEGTSILHVKSGYCHIFESTYGYIPSSKDDQEIISAIMRTKSNYRLNIFGGSAFYSYDMFVKVIGQLEFDFN
jgi:hypothetical protein